MWTVNNTSLDKRFNTYYSLSEIMLFYIFKLNIFFVVSFASCSSAEGKRAKTGQLSSRNDEFTQSSTVGESTRNYVTTFRKNLYAPCPLANE